MAYERHEEVFNRKAVATSSPGLPSRLPWETGMIETSNRNAVAPTLDSSERWRNRVAVEMI
jgi:hypothetical protein